MAVKETSPRTWQLLLERLTPVSPHTKHILDRLTEGLTELNETRVIDNAGGAIMAVHVTCDGQAEVGAFYTVAHYPRHAETPLPDPRMSFLKAKEGNYYPLSFEQSDILAQEVLVFTDGRITSYRLTLEQGLVSFCSMWMNNIGQQQFDEPDTEEADTSEAASSQAQRVVAKFPSGRIVGTPGAVEAMKRAGQEPAEFLDRHFQGDWGEVEDADANEHALQHGLRLLSVYHTKEGERLFVITEADRSSTAIMLPSDY